MEIEKAWLSTETGKKSRYGYRTIGGILGIVLLMVLLLWGGTFLSRSLGMFTDFVVCCQCFRDRACCSHEPTGNSGCYDFFSDRK